MLDRTSSTFVGCVVGLIVAGSVGARIGTGSATIRSLGAVLWNHGRRGHVREVR